MLKGAEILNYEIYTSILTHGMLSISMLYITNCFYDIYFYKCEKNNITLLWITYFIYWVVGTIIHITGGSPLINIAINLSFVSIITLFYQSKFTHRIFAVFITAIITMSSELFVLAIYSLIFSLGFEDISTNENQIILLTTMVRVLLLAILKTYQYSKVKKTTQKNTKQSTLDCLTAVSIPTYSIIIVHCIFMLSKNQGGSNLYVIVPLLIILIVNILFYYFYEKLVQVNETRTTNRLLEQQIEYYTSQYDEIIFNSRESQKLKHDLKHKLIFIQSQIKIDYGDMTSPIAQELSNLIGEFDLSEEVVYTQNVLINTILNYKVKQAKLMGIDFDINLDIEDTIELNEKDICVILGNALDNAMENFSTEHVSLKNIKLLIYQEPNHLYISISNPFIGKMVLKNGLPVTNKKDASIHGIGLASIKMIIDNQHGFMKINFDEHIFKLDMIYEFTKEKIYS